MGFLVSHKEEWSSRWPFEPFLDRPYFSNALLWRILYGMDKNLLGQKGEDLATQYLEGVLGWKLLERNVHYRCGELDLVAEDEEGSLIFIEVKTRKSARFGGVGESLTPPKIQRLKRSCLEWMREHRVKQAFRIEFFGLEMKKGAWVLERFIVE